MDNIISSLKNLYNYDIKPISSFFYEENPDSQNLIISSIDFSYLKKIMKNNKIEIEYLSENDLISYNDLIYFNIDFDKNAGIKLITQDKKLCIHVKKSTMLIIV